MKKPKNIQDETTQFVMVDMESLVPKEHFLRRLAELIPWSRLALPFEACFKGGKEYGPKGYPVSMLLKMSVLSQLFNMSDPQTEDFVKENLPARFFVGLGLLQKVPDSTTLCRFRGRIIKDGKTDKLSHLFDEILVIAQKSGIEMGKVQVLDSVHTKSKIDKEREDKERKKAEKKGEDPPPPRDPDATWGCKGKKKVKDPETGELREEKKFFFGYKTHVSLNQKTGLVTSALISTGSAADCTASIPLLQDDLGKKMNITVVTADKAYDDSELHMFLGKHNIINAVALKEKRTNSKSKKNNDYWQKIMDHPFYRKALSLRYKIEQKFGEAKLYHGLAQAKYLGLVRFAFQSIMTFLSMNLKRMVMLLAA